MAKFVFKLDPLLRLRRRQEQEKQRALAAINQKRVQLEQRLRQQQSLITSGKGDLRERLVGRLDTDELRSHAASTTQSLRVAQRLAVELAGVHRHLAAAREELVEATRARRAMELLRDRRFQQWKTAQDKADVAATDELAVIAAARPGCPNGMESDPTGIETEHE